MFKAYFPPAANIGLVFAVFIILLLVLHILLVWPRNLSKKSWKYVDYFWLAFAGIGLVGASANVRIYIAVSELVHAEARVSHFYDLFRNILELNAREDGYVCRTFIKGEFSPPEPEFSDLQKEFDRVCIWLQQTEEAVPKSLPKNNDTLINLEIVKPYVTNVSLVEVLKGLDQQHSYYVEAYNAYLELKAESQQSPLEVVLNFLAPWMLAFALSLRIAKVSGELRHER